MKVLKLSDIYDFLSTEKNNQIIVPDEVYEIFEKYRKAENAYQSKRKYHKAYYSLDCNDGLELLAIQKVKDPNQLLMEKELQQRLLQCVFSLPQKQSQRVYAYFYLDMSVKEIAEVEDINSSAVSHSIYIGLHNLKKMKIALNN